MFNYDFTIGDKVCTKSGAWGILMKSACGEWDWVCCYGTNGYVQGGIYGIFCGDDIYNDIISIGYYDFTKPQKIEKIKDCIMLNLKECNYTDKRLVEKINEIIDHINSIEEKLQ